MSEQLAQLEKKGGAKLDYPVYEANLPWYSNYPEPIITLSALGRTYIKVTNTAGSSLVNDYAVRVMGDGVQIGTVLGHAEQTFDISAYSTVQIRPKASGQGYNRTVRITLLD